MQCLHIHVQSTNCNISVICCEGSKIFSSNFDWSEEARNPSLRMWPRDVPRLEDSPRGWDGHTTWKSSASSKAFARNVSAESSAGSMNFHGEKDGIWIWIFRRILNKSCDSGCVFKVSTSKRMQIRHLQNTGDEVLRWVGGQPKLHAAFPDFLGPRRTSETQNRNGINLMVKTRKNHAKTSDICSSQSERFYPHVSMMTCSH